MSRDMPNKLHTRIDGALELLDRQLLDAEGRMLGKVDDVELTHTDHGLTVTALLTGQIALLHRLGGRLGNELATKYVQLRPQETNRARPWRILIDDVDRLDSAVHLNINRDESMRRDIETFRLGTLTGMEVLEPNGHSAGRVLDARFNPSPNRQLTLEALVVGHGHPGSLLGYDRRPDMGPWVLRRAVGWLHRRSRLVDAKHAKILWNNREVHLDQPLNDISGSLTPQRDHNE
jgi:sporulation protein YlmC with PRC-barrel domain